MPPRIDGHHDSAGTSRRTSRRAGATSAALALTLALASLTPGAFATQAAAAPEPERDFASMVDPFVGTEGDYGNDMPAAMAPNGLAKVNPRTSPARNHTGYEYTEDHISGFTHTNLDGVGGSGGGGDILVVPTSGDYTSRPSTGTYEHPFTHAAETAEPGYYQVELGNIAGTDGAIADAPGTIDAEVTATTRSGVHRYAFPEDSDPSLVVDLSTNNTSRISSSLEVEMLDDGRASIGGQIVGHFYNASYTLYYYAETTQPVAEVQTWGDDGALTDALSQDGRDTGLVLTFDSADAADVGLELTLSPISVEQARIDQAVELDGKSFDDVRAETYAEWNRKLGKVAVGASAATDPSGELEQLFYTHLYRMFAMPMNATSTSGTYRGVDGAVHRAHGFTYYDSWATWDDFRKFSVIAAIDPELYRDQVQSMVYLFADAASTGSTSGLGGFMHTVPTVRWERSSVVIADAIAKGFTGLDRLDEAYPALQRLVGGYSDADRARGYKPGDPGATVQLGYDQWALGVIAEDLGMEDVAADLYAQASLPIDNLTKPGAWTAPNGTEVGVLTPRASNGDWESADYERFEAHRLYQGTLWQYHWYDAYDMDALIEAMGGEEAAYQAMRHLFGEDGPDDGSGMLHSNANEIDLQAPYLFNYVGQAHLTQKWTRAIYTKETWNRYIGTGSTSAAPSSGGEFRPPIKTKVYKLDPQGMLPTMDNDAGTMSTMYVSAALGLFPVTAGSDEFQIGSPFFDSAVISYDNGRTFTVTADDVAEDRFYIQSASLNGAGFGDTFVDYATLLAGGELAFQMGAEPSDWGSDSAPAYSMSTAVEDGPGNAPRVSVSSTTVSSDATGAVDGTVELALEGARFDAANGEDLLAGDAARIVGLPGSIDAALIVEDSTTATLSLTGTASADATFYVSLTDAAIAGGASAAELTGQGISLLSPLRLSVAAMERAALEDLVERASLVRKGNYSTVTFTALEDALAKARTALGDADASSTDLRFAADALSAAIADLTLAEGGFRRLEAEESDAWSGGELKNEANQSAGNLGGVRDESWVRYFDMDFMDQTPQYLEIRYDTSFGPGDEPSTVEVRAGDEDGELITTVDLTGTSGWGNYRSVVAGLEDVQALANEQVVTFVLLAPDGRSWVGNFDWFQFSVEDPAAEPEPLPGADVVLEAESWDSNSGGGLKNEGSTWNNAGAVTNLGGTTDGAWLLYEDVEFGAEALGEVSVGYVHNASRCGNDSRIEVYLDDFDPANPGEPHTVIDLPSTGTSWSSDGVATAMLGELVTGTHDVYLRLRTDAYDGNHPYVANIDSLTFTQGAPSELVVEAESFDGANANAPAVEGSTWTTAGSVTNIGHTGDGDWLRYDAIDFGSGALDQVSVAYVHNSGRCGRDSAIEVYLDEFDPASPGEPFAVIDLPSTGTSWSSDGVATIDLPESLRGTHDVYLRLRTDAYDSNHPYVANIDKLTFFTEVSEPEPDPVDWTALEAAIERYAPLADESERYGDIDAAVFLDELEAARSLVASATASQEAVDEQTRRLTLAAEQLVPAERRMLENAIADVEAMDPDGYTAASWSALLTELEDARGVLEDAEASDGELADARSALTDAVEALELEPTAPEAPADVVATVDGSSVTVTWEVPADGGSELTGYVVELSDGSSIRIEDPATTAVTFTWLAPGESITAQVTAINAVGESEVSEQSPAVQVGTSSPGRAGAPSSSLDDATLAAIDVDGVILGGFDPQVSTYVVSWPENRALPEVGAQTSAEGASVTIEAGVTGLELLGGTGRGAAGAARLVAPGAVTMTITVESADASVTQTYAVVFAQGAGVTLPSELVADGGDGSGDGAGDGDPSTGGDGAGDGSGDGSGDGGLAITGPEQLGLRAALAVALLMLGAALAVAHHRRGVRLNR